jgi:broad specificity phosphatase PhoE
VATRAERWLYVVRHGEATADESGLTERGRRQARFLGERLRGVQLAAVHHGPLARAEETARLAAESLGGVPVRCDEAAGDYLPYTPRREELPEDAADFLLDFVHRFPEEERRRGPALAAEAEARFTGTVAGDEPRHELLVTHNFLVGWLVRAALRAPAWRWLGINTCNSALTVIRYPPGRLPYLLVHNDMTHLPDTLRWTGVPPETRAC